MKKPLFLAAIALTSVLFANDASAAGRRMTRPAPTQENPFGGDIETHDLRENPRFEIQDNVIYTFKVYRTCAGSLAANENEKLPMVSISIITDKKTGRVYHENTTFRHIDDGDNSMGWIEEVTGAANEDSGVPNEGRVVASIGDSFVSPCK